MSDDPTPPTTPPVGTKAPLKRPWLKRHGNPKPLSPADWEALKAAFRKHGPNFTAVSRETKRVWVTVRRAWEQGNSRFDQGKPIREQFQEEAANAQAAMDGVQKDEAAQELLLVEKVWAQTQKIRQAEAEQEIKLRKDSLEARTTETRLAQIGRQAVLNLGVVATKLTTTALEVEKEILSRLTDPVKRGAMGIASLSKVMELFARTVERHAKAVRYIVDAERVISGDPIGKLGVDEDDLTPDEMAAELAGVERLLKRAEKLGQSKVTDRHATAFDRLVPTPEPEKAN